MHSSSPANSMGNGAVLIAAVSGRALAASARRGGYLPLVADFFGDQDTVAAAHGHVTLGGEFAQGFREQWAHPTTRPPVRYAGPLRPADIAPGLAERHGQSACRLAAALSLTGLNSADFMVDGDDFWILEINPRPGATLDIFEDDEASLFSLHMRACAGDLPDEAPRLGGAKASAIFYAERDVIAPERFEWPDWSADRPNAGIAIKAGEPVCTVHAGPATGVETRTLVDKRLASVHMWMHDWTDGRMRTKTS